MSVLGVLYIYIYLHLGNILFTTIMKAVIGRGLIQYRSIQIYHVWEGYLRKIPVERRKISRAEWRGKFSLKTGIFRKYPSQT
jgi:hypothetical protein